MIDLWALMSLFATGYGQPSRGAAPRGSRMYPGGGQIRRSSVRSDRLSLTFIVTPGRR